MIEKRRGDSQNGKARDRVLGERVLGNDRKEKGRRIMAYLSSLSYWSLIHIVVALMSNCPNPVYYFSLSQPFF